MCGEFVCLQWKEHERMVMEEENRRLLQYAKEQEEREAERMAQEKKSEESKTLVYQKVRVKQCTQYIESNNSYFMF